VPALLDQQGALAPLHHHDLVEVAVDVRSDVPMVHLEAVLDRLDMEEVLLDLALSEAIEEEGMNAGRLVH
jgi:hypothetical protein